MNDNKLYISCDDKIISGVCGGIAERMDVSSTIVRMIFLLFTFATGLWIMCLAYYLFTLFLPIKEDDDFIGYSSRKKVKNLFLYSLIVMVAYSPLLLGVLYIFAFIFGISLLCFL